jgi:hypothetical protein
MTLGWDGPEIKLKEDNSMNHVHYYNEDCSTNFLVWGNHPAYLRLEREEGPEEADEMERLKDRQKEKENERRRERRVEQTRDTSLAEPDHIETWPA